MNSFTYSNTLYTLCTVAILLLGCVLRRKSCDVCSPIVPRRGVAVGEITGWDLFQVGRYYHLKKD